MCIRDRINIRKYLPEGTDIGQGEMDVISVVIKINKLVSKMCIRDRPYIEYRN